MRINVILANFVGFENKCLHSTALKICSLRFATNFFSKENREKKEKKKKKEANKKVGWQGCQGFCKKNTTPFENVFPKRKGCGDFFCKTRRA